MGKSIRGTKKSRGRPKTTGKGDQIGMRWQKPLLRSIDTWREAQEGKPSRPEAIRRLVELGLAGTRPTPRPSRKAAASKGSDMAGQVIDKLGDPSATEEERQTRKRRLLKGPKEFRDIRGDLPKPKG